MISFTVKGEPVGTNHGYKHVLIRGRPRTAMTEAASWYKALVTQSARRAMAKAAARPILGAVEVSLRFVYSANRSDADSPTKLTLDALQGVCFVNDRQVRRILIEKYVDPGDPRVEALVASASMTENGETWCAVAGYDGAYEVSDQGRVRSYRTTRGAKKGTSTLSSSPKLLTPQLHHGYATVLLTDEFGGRAYPFVHRLVTEAFLGPVPAGHQVNHRDAVKLHNSVGNLEYVTAAQNHEHAVALNLKPSGNPKLTPEQVASIRAQHALGHHTLRVLATEFGVTPEQISNIVHERQWKGVA